MNARTENFFQTSGPDDQTREPEADVLAYLRGYGLPCPPDVRHGHSLFRGKDGDNRIALFGQAWLPDHPRGLVLLVHGFAEHTGNYGQLIQDLVSRRFAVTAVDLRGHGLSEGVRGHVDSPTAYAEDLEAWMDTVYSVISPSKPLYLWGHSMGALACLQVLLRNRMPQRISSAVLTSPFLGFPAMRGLRKLAFNMGPLIARVAPAVPLPSAIDPADLSTDQYYLSRRMEDPLIHRSVTPIWVQNMQKAIRQVQSQARDFENHAPVLLMLAGDERITNLLAARSFAFHALSAIKHKVIEFPGALHELEKESLRGRVLQETFAWFESH